jgi:uncharacterized protein
MMTNRLAQETSPYLLQHADNPVDWYPWGEEALAEARRRDMPILLSVGYAACHWCHVMAHESFEDETTAVLMNSHFINIKVDREERPDIDQIYMNAVVAMTGQGGWPMTVALTPEGKPFWGGTYFPPTPRYGMPSFKQVLTSLAEAWEMQRGKIEESADGITSHLNRAFNLSGQAGVLDKGLLNTAVRQLHTSFDKTWGGFGQAPKFPQPMNLEFTLRAAIGTDDDNVRHMLHHTLHKMAQGGMYDHIGGGFARYSTDARWLVPHFEKMLYDNAQLARVYLHAWQVTGEPFYRQICEETLDYMVREMRHEGGGFYSSWDADSEGEEGKFYVWSLAEIQEVLGEDAPLFAQVYDITPSGNWEGKNIPNLPRRLPEVAAELGIESADLAATLAESRQRLYAVRAQRVWPGLDDKVLTAWNGLALAALAEAGRVLGRKDYVNTAVSNATFLYQTLRQSNGRLYRTWKAGSPAKYNGYLEDYAFLGDGLLALYQTTFDERWFVWARELADLMLTHFADENGGFFDTADDHEELIFRPKDVQDNAIPSGNSMVAYFLLQLGLYTGESKYTDTAVAAISSMYGAMAQYPTGFAQWLNGATLLLSAPREIALIGDPDTPEMQTLLAVAQAGYQPYQVVGLKREGMDTAVPLLQNRPQLHHQPTAYVCHQFTCQTPVTDPTKLNEQLQLTLGAQS